MLASLVAAITLVSAPPPRAAETALLKGVEACHGGVFDHLDQAAFLRAAGFVQRVHTEFEYDWRWRGDGFEIQAWNGMFGCGAKVIQGRFSDRDAVRLIRPWAERHGYQRPRNAVDDGSTLLYLLIKREEGFDISVDRDDSGQIRVSMAPGYFADR